MYVKPEVTIFTGKELLDLMGPVETGYCDLEGGRDACDLRFKLETPDSKALKDLFEDGEVSFGFNLRSPDGTPDCGTWKGVCLDNSDNCIFEENLALGIDQTYFPMITSNFCETVSTCSADGKWTLEAWWVVDGEKLPSCTERFSWDSEPDPPPITYTGTAAGDIDRYGGGRY